jgi:predicted dehydrogenase
MLGYGFMGRAHSNAFRAMPAAFWPEGALPSLKVIAGRSADAVAEAATRFGFASYTQDWEDVVTDPDVAVFDNVGPDALHLEPSLAAIAAGKDVICEKPLAWAASDARRMADEAKRAGVRTLTCFNYRFVPAVQLARTIVASGDLGEVFTARFHYSQEWRTDSNAWLPTRSGAINTIGCHAIDLAHFIVGSIADVSAVITSPVTTSERGEQVDTLTSVVRFAEGAVGSIDATLIAPGRRNHLGFEISGSKGTVLWDLENLNNLYYFDRDGSSVNGFRQEIVCESHHPLAARWWPTGHVLGWEHSHINMLGEFLAAVSSGQDTPAHAATFDDGARAAEVADAMTKSAESGARTAVVHP